MPDFLSHPSHLSSVFYDSRYRPCLSPTCLLYEVILASTTADVWQAATNLERGFATLATQVQQLTTALAQTVALTATRIHRHNVILSRSLGRDSQALPR